MVEKGKLIAFEGLDGSGKTTQINLLKYYFDSRFPKQKTEIIKFPTYKFIKEDFYNQDLSNTTIQLLCLAEIVETMEKEVIPKLNNGVNILLDRFILSNYLHYSIGGCNDYISQEFKYSLLDLPFIEEYLTANIWIDVSPQIALKNLNGRGNKNKFETIGNLTKTYKSFHCDMNIFKFINTDLIDKTYIINGFENVDMKNAMEIHNDIINILDHYNL